MDSNFGTSLKVTSKLQKKTIFGFPQSIGILESFQSFGRLRNQANERRTKQLSSTLLEGKLGCCCSEMALESLQKTNFSAMAYAIFVNFLVGVKIHSVNICLFMIFS